MTATASTGTREPQAQADQPLRGRPRPHNRLHPKMYGSELAGTAALVLAGLSVVIALNGAGAPLAGAIAAPGLRRLVTGFLFGTVGLLISVSPVGKISGAHINPAVTLAFWLEGKIAWRDALGYAAAQLAGGIAGAVPLLAWGSPGGGIDYGATLPAQGAALWAPLAGEIACTFLLVTIIFACAAHRRTQPLTPFTMPPLFAILVWLEGPLSGTSTNPARSLGPALLAPSTWTAQWIYILGPCLGAALAVAVLRLEETGRHRPLEARLFHFSHQDR